MSNNDFNPIQQALMTVYRDSNKALNVTAKNLLNVLEKDIKELANIDEVKLATFAENVLGLVVGGISAGSLLVGVSGGALSAANIAAALKVIGTVLGGTGMFGGIVGLGIAAAAGTMAWKALFNFKRSWDRSGMIKKIDMIIDGLRTLNDVNGQMTEIISGTKDIFHKYDLINALFNRTMMKL
jgi:hypothetical protein